MSPARVHATRAGLVSAVVAFTLLLSPSVARADPTVTEIEQQINAIWADAEPLIEQYNAVHEQYKKNLAKQAALQNQIAPLQRQVELGQVRVGVLAAQAYKGGQADAFNAILGSGSPDTLAEQLTLLDQLARDQQRQIAGVVQMKAQYDDQKRPIDEVVAQLAAQDADLAAKKKVIEEQLRKLQALRLKAYGSTGSTGSYRPWPCPSEYLPTAGYKAANFACTQAGKPYVWAADGPTSYDCSGLTLASWAKVGVYLPHNAAAQRRSMPYVSRANLQIGDLVFYFSDLHHVAIYVGNGKVMHAPTFGDHVRMAIMDEVGPIHSFGRPNG
ncbi:MAG: NlpC/P60 family protein [Micromonosporaceae bacterium]